MTVTLKDIVHIYRSPSEEPRTVLDIAHWRVEPGEQWLVRGVSGSGKTTLFNIMTGLLHPTKGTVHYEDTSLYRLPEAQRDRFRARNVGYVFQNHFLLNTLTAIENVKMPMAFARSAPAGEWESRARELLTQVGLADHLDYRPAQMSTGQRMRVAVARALANNPGIIFADEPTASLDAATGEIVMDLIQQQCEENNAILLVASHDPALEDRFTQFANLTAGELSLQEAQPA